MVLRTKRQLRTEPGEEGFDPLRNFARPEIVALPVRYTDDERDAHRRLEAYTALRKQRIHRGEQNIASDFISLVLKARLFSSPAAFRDTLDQHLRTLSGVSAETTTGRAGAPPAVRRGRRGAREGRGRRRADRRGARHGRQDARQAVARGARRARGAPHVGQAGRRPARLEVRDALPVPRGDVLPGRACGRVDGRARHRVHAVHAHARLAPHAPARRRAAGRADGPDLRRDGREAARADQGDVPAAAAAGTRSGSSSPPTRRARASTCRTTATASSTWRSRSLRRSSRSGTAASTASASRARSS